MKIQIKGNEIRFHSNYSLYISDGIIIFLNFNKELKMELQKIWMYSRENKNCLENRHFQEDKVYKK